MAGPDFERDLTKEDKSNLAEALVEGVKAGTVVEVPQDYCIKTLLEGIKLHSIKFRSAFNLGDIGIKTDPQSLIDTLHKYGIQVRYEDAGGVLKYYISRRIPSTDKKWFYEARLTRPSLTGRSHPQILSSIRHYLMTCIIVVVIKSEKELGNG